ncbi:MAG: nucleotidyltransferase domain-containing protein [Methanosarcinales archaeon]|nr:MAG: nucleotidyltransferase domain-containing protein [Methanosarcinales archaeon]
MKTELINELIIVVKKKFKQDLLSVVLFGSKVKGTSTATSDLDVLVVSNSVMKDWRERDELVLNLTEDIELKYTTPIHMILVNKDEISNAIESVYPLMLEIYESNEIVYDKENFFKKILEDFNKNIHRWHAEKIEEGVWKIPGLAVI